MRLGITLVALCACLALPAAAQAGPASGTLVVSPVGSDQIRLDISVEHACPESSLYCGWFPVVVQVAATAPCFDSSPALWVGDLTESPGEVYSAVEYPYGWYDGAEAIRLCLFVYHEGVYEKLAEAIHQPAGGQPPTPPPPPVVVPPPPPTTPVEAPRLTLRETRSLVRQVLRRRFGSRFSHRRRYSRSCFWWTDKKARCRVRWDYKKRYRYSGTVTIWLDPDDPERFFYRTAIRRKSLKPRRQATPPPPPPPPASSPACDPNYGGCLDPNASDYDCAGGSGDGPRYTGPVRVIGNDHFDLDRDGDGVGCDD